ncbi:MAG: TIGR04282 family arsenosugar biosynthesis glycosyltransferase [Pseudomonadota bacterium]
MVKEPRPGRVKTRLGREIGHTAAAWWYRHHTRRLLRRLRDPRWQTVLAVAPDREGLLSHVWPSDIARIPQGKGDLGHRMGRMLRQTRGPSVLIGSDIPAIERVHIAEAFRLLGACPSVIGPAPDGGFWLVGLSHPPIAPQDLFQGVRWSHPETLQDTLPTLPQPVARAATLSDVDEASDLLAMPQQGADKT